MNDCMAGSRILGYISMGQSQCPMCYSALEIRDVTPCYICGGRPESVAQFDFAVEFREFRLPDGQVIVMCWGCELGEFMVPGGWGYRIAFGEALPINALQWSRSLQASRLQKDKFCPACNLRLAFLDVVAKIQQREEAGDDAASE